MAACTVTLYGARALFVPYLLVVAFSLYCLCKDTRLTYDRRSRSYRLIILASFVAAVFITLANHTIWMRPALPDDLRTPLIVRLCKLLLILTLLLSLS